MREVQGRRSILRYYRISIYLKTVSNITDTTIRIGDFQVESRTEDLHNTKQECRSLSTMLDYHLVCLNEIKHNKLS
jgi:hypothetical protein